jgi:hypothetical protein
MRAGEKAVSLLVVTFVALKVAEGALAIDSWPLSNVPMFSSRAPRELAPIRITLVGRRADRTFPVAAVDVGLTDDELAARLRGGPVESIPGRCGAILATYNATHGPPLRLDRLEARLERIPRPGVGGTPFEAMLPCIPIGTAP